MSEAEAEALRRVLSDESLEPGKLSDYLLYAHNSLNNRVFTAMCDKTATSLWPAGTMPSDILSEGGQRAFIHAIQTQIKNTLRATLSMTVTATSEEYTVDYVKGWYLEDESDQGLVRCLTEIRPVSAEGGEIEYEANLTTIAKQ